MSMEAENSQEGMLVPGQLIKPPIIDQKTTSGILRDIFGLELESMKQLESFDDRNYLVKASTYGESNSSHLYVLKVMNSMDSRNVDLINGQNEMMLFLKQKGFNVSYPLPTKDMTYMHLENFSDESGSVQRYAIRLMWYVSGEVVAEKLYTKELFFQIGNLTARIDFALKSFFNDAIMKREFLWMLESVPRLCMFIKFYPKKERLEILEEVLAAWDKVVSPTIPHLEKGFIHGDMNEQNILVSDMGSCGQEVNAVLDFGDVSYSCHLFELAIVIAYMSMDTTEIPIIDVGGYVVRGYLTTRKLSELEWNVLKECVCARLSQSLILGAYSYLQHPNNGYLLSSSEKGFKALKEIWKQPKEDLIKLWKEISHK